MTIKETDDMVPHEYVDRQVKLYDVAREWGCTHEQAQDFSVLRRDLFGFNNAGELVLIETGMPALSDETRNRIAREWPYLMPPKVEVSLSDLAFLKNDMTARGKLVREVGEDAATELARTYGHASLVSRAQGTRPEHLADPEAKKKQASADERRNNPWSKAGWNISKQGSVVKSLGLEKAAGIAAAVGSRIGATKPNPNY